MRHHAGMEIPWPCATMRAWKYPGHAPPCGHGNTLAMRHYAGMEITLATRHYAGMEIPWPCATMRAWKYPGHAPSCRHRNSLAMHHHAGLEIPWPSATTQAWKYPGHAPPCSVMKPWGFTMSLRGYIPTSRRLPFCFYRIRCFAYAETQACK